MGKNRQPPPSDVFDETPEDPKVEAHRKMQTEARKLSVAIDRFLETINQGDDLSWYRCWIQNFARLTDVITQTIRIEEGRLLP